MASLLQKLSRILASSSVNAHHQNGIAKCYIQMLTENARTMLIYAMLSWPEKVTENLWSFAI
jgi:hypothetical protein